MNIKFMQSGGGMPPFTYYQPVVTNTSQPDRSGNISVQNSKNKSDKNDLGQKDLLKMLQDLGGLKSDRDEIFKTIEVFFKEDALGMSNSSLATIYLRALNQMISAKNNQVEYNNIYKALQGKEALSEIAVDPSGKIAVMLEGDKQKGIYFVSPQEYINNKNKYKSLTNLDILRKRDLELPFNNKLLDIAANGISLQHIDKLITQYMAQLGSDTYKESGMIETQQNQIIKGIEYLQEASLKAQRLGKNINTKGLGVEGLYKANLLTKDQATQAMRSISYILRMLPQNAKSLLLVKSGSAEGVYKLIADVVLRTTDTTFEMPFTYDEDDLQNTKNNKKSTSEGDLNLSSVQQMILEYGYQEPVVINLGNSYQYTGKGLHNTLVTKEGDPLSVGDSLKDVSRSQQSSVLDFDNATFGGSRLNDLALDWTSIKSNNMIVLDLPYKILSTGVKMPNLELLEKLEIVDDLIKKRNINPNDYAAINTLCQQQGIPPKYVQKNGEWALNSHAYMRFGMIYTNLDERVLADTNTFNQNWVDVVTDDDAIDQFNTLIRKKTNDKDYAVTSGILESDKIYRGPIFIPIKQDFIQASQSVPSSSQVKITGNNASDIYTKQAINKHILDLQSNYIQPPSLNSLKNK